ncbi:flagellar hook assembly protein FlgD [Phreatobacter stygius]|nr:flagellar hook capping FlgD N-terminal domain-containing protein [Phreatobacter stygius]
MVDSTSPVSNNGTSNTSASRSRLSTNFDTFLLMLTTQLKNQDPTQPMDANQFTQQLVQYSQIEQQLSTNDKLDKLIANSQGNQATTALGYLGTKVSFDASQATPGTSETKWTFTAATGDYTVRIRDAAGKVVKEQAVTVTGGAPSSYTWDNNRSDGSPVGTGTYTMELWQGTGAAATKVNVVNTGQVSSVDTSGSEITVTVGTQKVPVSKIKSITL